jgi:hypothetical protein
MRQADGAKAVFSLLTFFSLLALLTFYITASEVQWVFLA